MNSSHPTVFLVGCGRVGCTVALGLKQAGYRIAGVRDRDRKAEQRARRLLMGDCGLRIADCGLRAADIVLLGTPDGQIDAVYREIAARLVDRQIVVHFSGALGSEILCRAGGRLAMHPVMTFPAILARRRERDEVFRNCYFALEGNRKGIFAGRSMVRALGAKAFVIRAGDKPLFHAACVVASNFTDVVLDAALELAGHAGLPPGKAWHVLAPLIRATLGNVERLGSLKALSGPIVRADHETVRRHLVALRASSPELVPLYKALAERALTMTRRKRNLSPVALRALRGILS